MVSIILSSSASNFQQLVPHIIPKNLHHILIILVIDICGKGMVWTENVPYPITTNVFQKGNDFTPDDIPVTGFQNPFLKATDAAGLSKNCDGGNSTFSSLYNCGR